MIDVLIESPGRIALNHGPVPGPLKRGEVLVEVQRVSLCGSDYRLFEGTYGGPRRYPIRFGHEWSGRIVDLHAKSRLHRNALVTGDCSKWCGYCDLCQADKNLCRNIEKFGITTDGFSSQYRIVEEKYLYQDDLGMTPRLLALVEIFAVALRGVERADADLNKAGEVLILGAGPLGLAAYFILKHEYSIPDVKVIETNRHRVESARTWVRECEFTEELLEENSTYQDIDRLSRYPVIFECAGSASALNQSLSRVAKGGLVVCLGITPPARLRTDLLVTKALRLQGSIGGTGAFPRAMRFIARNADAIAGIVTHEFPMEEAQKVFEQKTASSQQIKTQLVFEES